MFLSSMRQFFSVGVFGVVLGMALFVGGFVFLQNNYESQRFEQKRLQILLEGIQASIYQGDFDLKSFQDFYKSLNVGVVIFDREQQKYFLSEQKFLQDGFVASQKPHYEKLSIDSQLYLGLFESLSIGSKTYDIGVFVPQKSKGYRVFWVEFLVLFGIFLIGSVLLVIWLQKNTQTQIKRIIYRLRRISEGDFGKINGEKIYNSEFQEISILVAKLGNLLEKREKKSKKHSKKLRLKYLQSSSIIAALSHEFKNPLAVISGYCETILEAETKNELSLEYRKRFLNKIYTQSQRLNQLLERLNLAVKLDNELLELQKTSFNFKPLIEEVVFGLKTRYPEKKIIVKLKDVSIKADRILMENVVANLIENALKYSKNKVQIVLKNDCFKVTDDGCGIEHKQIGLVTKKFYRLQKKHQENSLGLGLFIVKYILKLHQMELKIKSVPNKGSNFSFEL